MKIFSEVVNIIGIIVGVISSIIGLIGIAVSIAGMQQPQPEPEQPVCTVGNIVAGAGATVNINCTVAPQ